MRKYGLKALIWRGFKVKTTDSDHAFGYATNKLPGLSIDGPNQVWVADITYIRVLTGFVYLAAILDLFSRKVVGWAISRKIDHEPARLLANHLAESRSYPGRDVKIDFAFQRQNIFFVRKGHVAFSV